MGGYSRLYGAAAGHRDEVPPGRRIVERQVDYEFRFLNGRSPK